MRSLRPWLRRRAVASLLAASILACAVQGIAAAPAPAYAAVNAEATEAAVARDPVPAGLKETESAAEDIIDFVLAHDRGSVVARASSLRAAASGPAAASLTAAGVSSADVNRLKQRANRVAQLARGGSSINIVLAANAVSQLMPDLFKRFQDRVPASILSLDYLDREAQFRSVAGQSEKVATAVAALGRAWSRLRRDVIAAGGVKEAAAYQRHVVAMARLAPGAGKKLQAEAVHGLDLVDEIENVFAR